MNGRRFPRADLPVSVASWEIECCGSLPTVGEPTTLRLVFLPVGSPDPNADLRIPGSVTELPWQVEAPAGGVAPDGVDGRAVHRNGFAAYLRSGEPGPHGEAGPAPELGRQVLLGTISGARHGGTERDRFNAVTAVVDRVQVVSWDFRSSGRSLVAVPGSAELRDVQQSPKWFACSPRPRPTARRTTDGARLQWSPPASLPEGAVYRDESGLLLTLRDADVVPD